MPTPRITTFVDGNDLSELNASFWDALKSATLTRRGVGTSAFSTGWTADGGVHRVAVITGVTKGVLLSIDSSADWRDRILMTACLVAQSDDWSLTYSGPAYPGNPNDVLTRPSDGSLTGNVLRTGYTGDGTGHVCWLDTAGHVRLRASSSSGELLFYRDPADPDSSPATYYVMIWATPQLAWRSTPGTLASIVSSPAAGAHIGHSDLNLIQDRTLFAQVAGETFPSDAFPLGPKLDGYGVPELWSQAEYGRTRYEKRQPVVGALKRFFYAAPTNGSEVVIDSSADWRDRFVWGAGRFSTSEIGAGAAAETSHNTAASWTCGRYTGSGSSGANATQGYGLVISITGSQLQLRARSTDGALVLRNDTGSTQYVTGMVFASFQLGPRTPA